MLRQQNPHAADDVNGLTAAAAAAALMLPSQLFAAAADESRNQAASDPGQFFAQPTGNGVASLNSFYTNPGGCEAQADLTNTNDIKSIFLGTDTTLTSISNDNSNIDNKNDVDISENASQFCSTVTNDTPTYGGRVRRRANLLIANRHRNENISGTSSPSAGNLDGGLLWTNMNPSSGASSSCLQQSTSVAENQCSFCFKIFSNRGSMTRHMRDQHLEPNNTVDCDICGKICKNRNCLITHRSVAHNTRRRSMSVSTGAAPGEAYQLQPQEGIFDCNSMKVDDATQEGSVELLDVKFQSGFDPARVI